MATKKSITRKPTTRRSPVRKDNWLKKLFRHQLSWYILVFAIIGGVFIFRSFAATNSVTFTGSFSGKTLSKSYSIAVTSTGTMTASLTFSGKLSSTSLNLLDSKGGILATQTSSKSPITVSTPITTTGTYIAQVSAGKGTGSYTLTVNYPVPSTTPPPPDTTPPTAPTSLTTTATSTSQINLTWGASTDNVGVTAYNVYRNNALATTVTGTSYSDTGLTPSTIYTYFVKALDAAGNLSNASNSASATTATPPPSPQPPPPPTPPTVSITQPTGGSTLTGTVFILGSATSNTGIAAVTVSIDGQPFQGAGGTTSWSAIFNTDQYSDGAHTIVAKATDTSGTSATATVSVFTNNTPAGGQHWVSPEGVVIDIDAGISWTTNQIYQILVANAAAPGDWNTIAPLVNVKVTTSGADDSQADCQLNGSTPESYNATINLLATPGSEFSNWPDYIIGHEYGHVWTLYHLCMTHNQDWSPYLNERWSAPNGTTVLANDSRLNTSYMWSEAEMFAEDYRMLFGTSQAIAETPTEMNWQIPDARTQPGLRDWFLHTWGGL